MTEPGALQQILVSLARIETRLDALASDRADHEARLRALERARWVLVGAAAVAGGLTGRLAGLL